MLVFMVAAGPVVGIQRGQGQSRGRREPGSMTLQRSRISWTVLFGLFGYLQGQSRGWEWIALLSFGERFNFKKVQTNDNRDAKDQAFLFAPCPDCPCQAGASSRQVKLCITGQLHLILVLWLLNLLCSGHPLRHSFQSSTSSRKQQVQVKSASWLFALFRKWILLQKKVQSSMVFLWDRQNKIMELNWIVLTFITKCKRFQRDYRKVWCTLGCKVDLESFEASDIKIVCNSLCLAQG